MPGEPVRLVSEETLRLLLAEQHESEVLDYKSSADLRDKRTLLELAKDIAAMQVEGGHLIIGADDRGAATGRVSSSEAELFDESRLRAKLRRWIPEPFQVQSASHTVDANTFVIVHVSPNPAGFVVMADDGRWDNDKDLVFRRGDVYVRHGTASELWNQRDIDRIVAKRVATEKDRWRAELADDMKKITTAESAHQITRASGAAVSWQIDEATFDAAVLDLLRRDDDVPLRLLMLEAPAAAIRSQEDDAVDDSRTALNRIAEVAALSLFVARPQWATSSSEALAVAYGRGGAVADRVAQADFWMSVMARVFAIGGVAVRTENWPIVRALVEKQPRGIDNYWKNWIRHAFTHAARAELPRPNADGERRHLSFIEDGRAVAAELAATRLDHASDDASLDSIVQFDVLAALVAGVGGTTGREFKNYYPTFYLWYAHRAEPIVRRLIRDHGMRAALLDDGTDQALAAALATLASPPSELWSSPWFGWESEDIVAFIDRFTPAT